MNKEKYFYQDIKTLERDFQVKVMSNRIAGKELHWHEYFELLYFTKGEVPVDCGNERYKVKAGELIVINSNELHSLAVNKDKDSQHHICIQISPQFFADVEFNNYIFKPHIKGDAQIGEYFEKILALWQNQEIAYDIEIKSQTYALMAYLIKNYVVDFLSDSATKIRKNKLQTMNEIIMYISNNYRTHMTTSSLAEEFHITEQYFCNMFKQATGQTPIDYINRKRINKAQTLIKTTEQSITDIALAVGFDNSHYFTRVFKKYTGVSPREYRKTLGV